MFNSSRNYQTVFQSACAVSCPHPSIRETSSGASSSLAAKLWLLTPITEPPWLRFTALFPMPSARLPGTSCNGLLAGSPPSDEPRLSHWSSVNVLPPPASSALSAQIVPTKRGSCVSASCLGPPLPLPLCPGPHSPPQWPRPVSFFILSAGFCFYNSIVLPLSLMIYSILTHL